MPRTYIAKWGKGKTASVKYRNPHAWTPKGYVYSHYSKKYGGLVYKKKSEGEK